MGIERTMTNETKKDAAAGPLGPGQRWNLSRKREAGIEAATRAGEEAARLGLLHWCPLPTTSCQLKPSRSAAATAPGPDCR